MGFPSDRIYRAKEDTSSIEANSEFPRHNLSYETAGEVASVIFIIRLLVTFSR